MVGLAAVGFLYSIGMIVAYAIYRGRKAPMIAVVSSDWWRTAFLAAALVGLAYVVGFVILIA
jgi:multidrug transporter EmrE-like cation transporter